LFLLKIVGDGADFEMLLCWAYLPNEFSTI
jgi:hypothetical protein